jgi:hypothetical protein
MSEPTTPPAPVVNKPQVNIPAGWVAFVKVDEKRALGISQFRYPSIGFSDLLLIAKPTANELLAELTRLGYSYPTPPAPPAP